MAQSSTARKNSTQSHSLLWTKTKYISPARWAFERESHSFCLALPSSVYVCPSQCGCPDALLLLHLCSAADSTLISLVWSSQMEPEHDLFPGETVYFLCPAFCTKSHIVPLLISHTDSPLQVLGYLADRSSKFTSFFFFLSNSQEYSIACSLPPVRPI